MTLSLKQVGRVGALALAVVALLAIAAVAHANPFYVGSKAKSAAATTTVTYMTPGTATTTVVYDSYEQAGTNQQNQGNITLANSVAVMLQGVASSTSSVLGVACEFSDDGIDWYQNEIYPATTTGAQPISAPVSYSMTYAVPVIGGVSPSTNVYRKVVECPVPLRYVRAVITATGANASVWAAITPKKQRN